MQFNRHLNLEGRHAQLSPSQYHWIRYDEAKMHARWVTSVAARRGTQMHQLAHDLIKMGVKLPRTTKTINQYVNDAIGFKMQPEVMLYYSDNCFGTADAISFRDNVLHIHDLKTGESKASVDQLLVYCALFCLEYGYRPFEILYDLRIYQSDDVAKFEVDPADVAHIMDKIKTFSKYIDNWRQEEE